MNKLDLKAYKTFIFLSVKCCNIFPVPQKLSTKKPNYMIKIQTRKNDDTFDDDSKRYLFTV